ncbi:MAG: molybdopterin-dependent oxidoreductase [Deltaproteobacteria bacterium]|nr:molybdopterin-dependent oxidoreductase [Deltaproteobacteria bacterium]
MKQGKKSKHDEKWVHSACAMCIGAPMKVKLRNNKIVEVRGEDIPDWDGKVCGKAISGIGSRIYPPDRILYPLKRIGRGDKSKLVRCSWEEVINAVALKLKKYIDAGHPEYFEIWWGCPYQQDNVNFIHYWTAVLRSGISYLHGQVCFGDHAVEKTVTFGPNHASNLIFGVTDWLRTKYAVIAGQNFPGTANNAGGSCPVVFWKLINKAKENGCKFIIVDPKLQDSTPWSHEWVPIKPGSDAAFAISLAKVLIDRKLYDKTFLLQYTNAPQLINKKNGEALRDKNGNYLVWDTRTRSAKPIPKAGEAAGLTLGVGKTFEVAVDGENVSCETAFQIFSEAIGKEKAVSPIPQEKVYEIATELGENRPSAIVFPGMTSGRYPNWFQTLRAYSVVNLLLGNFDQPGGFYFLKNPFNLGMGWPEPPEVPEYREGQRFVPGPWGNLMSDKTIDKAPCYKEPREFHPATQALPWLHFEAIEKGRVRTVISSAENAAVTQTDSRWVEECLKNLDLLIVGDQVPKDIMHMADYVIPEASYLERYHLYFNYFLGSDDKEHSVLFMRSAVIPPQGESKPLSWFLMELAKRVGLGKYFEKLDLEYEWWDKMLKKARLYPNVTARKLIDEGPYSEEHPIVYNLLFRSIATKSGRFEIYSNELAEECYYNAKSRWYHSPYVHPLPKYISIAKPRKENEFYLVCGKATWHQKSATQNDRYLMEDAIEGDCEYTPIYINTERARRLGLVDGDLVEVECIGPTKGEDPCVYHDMAIGNKEKGRVKVTEGLHPETAWIYFASGHKSNLMLHKAQEGIAANWLTPCSVSPYAGGPGKNYSIVKVDKIEEGD